MNHFQFESEKTWLFVAPVIYEKGITALSAHSKAAWGGATEKKFRFLSVLLEKVLKLFFRLAFKQPEGYLT